MRTLKSVGMGVCLKPLEVILTIRQVGKRWKILFCTLKIVQNRSYAINRQFSFSRSF